MSLPIPARPGNLSNSATDEDVLSHIISIVESTAHSQSLMPPEAPVLCGINLYTGLYVPASDLHEFISRLSISGPDPFVLHPFVQIFPGSYALFNTVPFNALKGDASKLWLAITNANAADNTPYVPVLSVYEYVLERIPYGAHAGDFMLNVGCTALECYSPTDFTVMDTHIYPTLARFGRIIHDMKLSKWRFVHSYCMAPPKNIK